MTHAGLLKRACKMTIVAKRSVTKSAPWGACTVGAVIDLPSTSRCSRLRIWIFVGTPGDLKTRPLASVRDDLH
jgi:hypothetical protein